MAEQPEYFDTGRSLCILRRLQQSPAGREALMRYVREELGAEAYADEARRAQKQFERDVARLRTWGCIVDVETGHLYHLRSYGTFSPVSLDDEALAGLAFLQEAFAPGAPEAEAVQALLRHVLDWLPQAQRSAVNTQRRRLRVDLRRKDDDVIPATVQAALDKAYEERRRLRFWYRSPGQADGEPRRHTVEPWYLHYDTVRHHLYLDAYRLVVEGPHGVWTQPRWQKYRPVRILADEIEVLPDRLPPTPPKRHSYAVEYLLAPEIARLGEISRHFERMEVHAADEEGWVRVTATTDDVFRAVQLLLGYGARCRVVGGEEVRREMEANVRALAGVYNFPG